MTTGPYDGVSNHDLLALDIALERRLKPWIERFREKHPDFDRLLSRATAVDEEIDRRKAAGTWEE